MSARNLVLISILAIGCAAESEPVSPPANSPASDPATMMPGKPMPGMPAATGIATDPASTGDVVPAQVGVGQQGRSLDSVEGVVVTPAKTFFAAKERIVFEIQIPEFLKLYKALEGQGPQSHEEFMEKIIQANSVKLPALPPGQSYEYDPQQEQLMVRRGQ